MAGYVLNSFELFLRVRIDTFQCSGAISGLVAATPASGFIPPWASIILGVTVGYVSNFSTKSKHHSSQPSFLQLQLFQIPIKARLLMLASQILAPHRRLNGQPRRTRHSRHGRPPLQRTLRCRLHNWAGRCLNRAHQRRVDQPQLETTVHPIRLRCGMHSLLLHRQRSNRLGDKFTAGIEIESE